ncbi:MAG: hypothetical protein MUP58_01290 [Candidatus Nanohaloarchaeota archaeon QJJ-9]|nr:hypothetical protein [Candidatus Nanohaloarchaeota archaeon QJJ-9]
MNRTFLLILDRARTDSEFTVNGAANNGRLDIGCRFINSSLFNSYSLRTDVEAHLLLRGPPRESLHLMFRGEEINGLHPDERSIAGYIKKNISSFENRGVTANQGVSIDKRGLEEIIEDHEGVPILLKEDSEDISSFESDKTPFFVIGDNKGLKDKDMDLIEEKGGKRLSLGEESYQAQQVVSYLNIFMDRNG